MEQSAGSSVLEAALASGASDSDSDVIENESTETGSTSESEDDDDETRTSSDEDDDDDSEDDDDEDEDEDEDEDDDEDDDDEDDESSNRSTSDDDDDSEDGGEECIRLLVFDPDASSPPQRSPAHCCECGSSIPENYAVYQCYTCRNPGFELCSECFFSRDTEHEHVYFERIQGSDAAIVSEAAYTSRQIHRFTAASGFSCDACDDSASNRRVPRFRCTVCDDFDFCAECADGGQANYDNHEELDHDMSHPMVLLDRRPGTEGMFTRHEKKMAKLSRKEETAVPVEVQAIRRECIELRSFGDAGPRNFCCSCSKVVGPEKWMVCLDGSGTSTEPAPQLCAVCFEKTEVQHNCLEWALCMCPEQPDMNNFV